MHVMPLGVKIREKGHKFRNKRGVFEACGVFKRIRVPFRDTFSV